ncbi:MAG: phosphoglycerate mutase family protein, partial [Acetobacteraceae bacterium]|nr:phosphoglycerate mutase family protein [Acetobacteraceae bacterium]
MSDTPRVEIARLLLLCHGATRATRTAAFPMEEPVEARDLAAAVALAGYLPLVGRVLVSPAPCARQTAAALGLAAREEPALRDCDWGRWRGRTLDAVTAT